ncbi:MAG: TrkH family potassium uptake protein [Treponema sp.]|jgi:trk system potassium uptake protein TrkH|nr:TrkH family potassium uptake protein [Treponema sp.]
MRGKLILRLLIFLLGLITLTMTIPLMLAVAYGEKEMFPAFGIPLGGTLILALFRLLLTRKQRVLFSRTDGLLLVFLAWVLTGILGGLPYYLSGHIPRFADAVFESVSGFTTTGVSVMADVEGLPRSLLLWRGMTHWFGGMGIVILTVALLPLLGAGDHLNTSSFFQAESTGPEKDKITPKITETAKILWLLYIGLTLLLIPLLMIGGMDWLDAVIHSFATIASGGFSTRNNSIAGYQSPWIDWVCIVFMFLAGFNFSVLYRLLQGKYQDLLYNSETKAYGGIVLVSVGIIALAILPETGSPERALRYASFEAVSIVSSTGFAATDHTLWPPLAQGILFFLMFIGGCSGSTAGGVKVIRHVVLFKQMKNEIRKLLYPKGVFSIRLHKKVGRKDVVYGVAGFVFLYLALVFGAALLIGTSGLDLFSSINLSLLALGNIGLGLGKTGPGFVFSGFPAYINWGLCFIMIAGRLELWAALFFFSRDYWRR